MTSSSSASPWVVRRRVAALGLGVTTALVGSGFAASHVALSTASCAARATTEGPPPPLLTTPRVYALLAPNEAVSPVRRGVVREVHSNQYAANPLIEDTLAIAPSVACPPGGVLCGVFDGHSGKDASRWCSEELLPYLQYYRWSNRTDELLHPRAFIEADHHFLELALRDQRYAAGLSGACLNVAHVSGNTVRTANAGDCRTIVGRRVARLTAAGETEYQYQAVELTTDHQIDTNHLERERLLRDHPDEPDIISRNRVKGRLQPTRGFGDGFYKRREYYTSRTLARPYRQWTPPYTTVEPDITTYQLQSEDEFMVMASDGLFQDLNSQQVVEYVGEWLSLQKAENARLAQASFFSTSSPAPAWCRNASTYLIKAALTHASEFAIGRRRRENENLSWILQLPKEAKRSYHDGQKKKERQRPPVVVVAVERAWDACEQPLCSRPLPLAPMSLLLPSHPPLPPDVSVLVMFFDHDGRHPSDAAPLSATGPPVPPTLSRALSLSLKTPPTTTALPRSDGLAPIKIAPIQQQQQQNQDKIRANL